MSGSIATPIIAALALLLGIFNSYILWRDRHPRLRIRGSVGFIPDVTDATLYTVDISNPSDRVIKIVGLETVIKGRRKMVHGSMAGLGPNPGTMTPLPHKLEPGDSATFWVELSRLQNNLKKQGYSGVARVTLQARDAVDRTHKKRVKIGLD